MSWDSRCRLVVRRSRQSLGWAVDSLAQAVGLSRARLNSYETGSGAAISDAALRRALSALVTAFAEGAGRDEVRAEAMTGLECVAYLEAELALAGLLAAREEIEHLEEKAE